MLDPEAVQILEAMVAAGIRPLEEMSIAEARAMVAEAAPAEVERVSMVEDHDVPGPRGAIPVRVFYPSERPGPAVAVYLHGGGWVLSGAATHDASYRALANRAGCAIVSVEYRLAPEHRFPAAFDDAYAATCWVAKHWARQWGDDVRLGIAGDSAGGNLAAAVCLRARDERGPRIDHQVLIYPALDADLTRPEVVEDADDPRLLLTAATLNHLWNQYLASAADAANPYAAPLRAGSFAGLPSAFVITAGYDPLCAEGEAYGAELARAGVAVRMSRYPGMFHGFFAMTPVLGAAEQAVDEVAGSLREALRVDASV